jgi:hypothetical protein
MAAEAPQQLTLGGWGGVLSSRQTSWCRWCRFGQNQVAMPHRRSPSVGKLLDAVTAEALTQLTPGGWAFAYWRAENLAPLVQALAEFQCDPRALRLYCGLASAHPLCCSKACTVWATLGTAAAAMLVPWGFVGVLVMQPTCCGHRMRGSPDTSDVAVTAHRLSQHPAARKRAAGGGRGRHGSHAACSAWAQHVLSLGAAWARGQCSATLLLHAGALQRDKHGGSSSSRAHVATARHLITAATCCTQARCERWALPVSERRSACLTRVACRWAVCARCCVPAPLWTFLASSNW